MHPLPSTPSLADAPAATTDEGHLWLREHVDGVWLRATVDESGVVHVGDAEGRLDSPPLPLRLSVRYLRERIDREAFREAVARAGPLTVTGVATVRQRVGYDWDRLPPFLGDEVVSDEGRLAPDLAERVLEGVNLTPHPTVEREVIAAHTTLSERPIPESQWRDGGAAGLLVRNKNGGRALRRASWLPDAEASDATSDADAESVVAAHCTSGLVDRAAGTAGGELIQRLLEHVARRAGPGLPAESDLRAALAASDAVRDRQTGSH